MHVAVDSLGNPVRIILTAGQVSEYRQANQLIEGFSFDFLLADKGYDSDSFVSTIQNTGASVVIPPRKNRTTSKNYDCHLYKERNLVERFFQKAKNFRRIATRYERLKRYYLALFLFGPHYLLP